MANALSAQIKTLLDRPNVAHLAPLGRDGSPQSTNLPFTHTPPR
jgi:hypothetical protein